VGRNPPRHRRLVAVADLAAQGERARRSTKATMVVESMPPDEDPTGTSASVCIGTAIASSRPSRCTASSMSVIATTADLFPPAGDLSPRPTPRQGVCRRQLRIPA
jgi:hypothetical protein